MPALALRAHPKATVVAEKLHAMTILRATNSRTKDFFDLWVLLHDTTRGCSAIEAPFVRRQTPMPAMLPLV